MARIGLLSLAAATLGLVGSTYGQTVAFNDPATGITFQQKTEDTFTFGMALPDTSSNDFIGRISYQVPTGWAGVALKGLMKDSLMVVAWPNEGTIISSLRFATGHSNPDVFTGTASLKPIESGTSFDSATSTFTFTFLCEGCVQSDGSTYAVDATTFDVGYAISNAAVTTPADPASPLGYHGAGYGTFTIDLAAAKSASFAEWAAMAASYEGTPAPGAGGNVTSPVLGGNGTARAPGGNGTTYPTGPVTISESTYDYIVVGSGPSGLIASQRLTETGKSVLLLERGMESVASSGGQRFVPWNSSLTYYDVPGVFKSLPTGTQGEGYCQDTPAVAGCLLGGGGSLNGMAFVHPPSFDFENWPEGWKWTDLASAAERLYERNPGTTCPSSDGQWYDNAAATVVSSWLGENGWSLADGILEPDAKARNYGPPQLNVANGIRSGPIHTYLPLAQESQDFKLEINTKVIRVLRDGSTMTGVEVENAQGRQIINLNPGGAVVLAAGVMSTPRILFNSGIGPPEQITTGMTSTGGDVPESDWINLPVGLDVKDHSLYRIQLGVTAGLTAHSTAQLLDPSEAEKDQYLNGAGVLTQSFQRLDLFMQYNTSDGHRVGFQAHCSSTGNNTIEIMILQTHGLTSSGTLVVNEAGSALFTTEPWINTDTDREAWELVINDFLEMARQPGSPVFYTGGSNATASEITSKPPQAGSHMVGSAKIGPDDGRTGGTAVVDLDAKVYGTDNLFIVDASIHADLPTGNTQAIVMVVAEYAVEKIIALGAGGSYAPSTPTSGGNGTTTGGYTTTPEDDSYPGTETGQGDSEDDYYDC